MPIDFERASQRFCDSTFTSRDEQRTLHIDYINYHEEKGSVAAFLRDAPHGLQQFRAALLDCGRAGDLDRADGKLCVAHIKFLEVGGQHGLGAAQVEISRRRRENLLPVLLDIFARDFSKFGSDALVARSAGGRTQDQRIVKQSGQQQAGRLAWDGDGGFVIQARDYGACAAYRVGAEHDWPVGMYIGDAVMIDDAQQIRFIDAIYRLRLLVMIDKDNAFGASVEQIAAREVANQLSLVINHRQRAPASQLVLHFAHLVFGVAG